MDSFQVAVITGCSRLARAPIKVAQWRTNAATSVSYRPGLSLTPDRDTFVRVSGDVGNETGVSPGGDRLSLS